VSNANNVEGGKLKLLFIDPSRAVQALLAFKSNSSSVAAVQRYQDDFLGSRIATLTDTLKEILSSINDSQSTNNIFTLRTQTALTLIRRALLACDVSLARTKAAIDTVSADISELNGKVEEARARVQGEVLGLSWQHDASGSTHGRGEVTVALKTTERDIRVVMDRLKWWRMVWQVDEVGGIVGGVVEKAWCKELEEKVG
jgi:hypothetical protein